MAFKKLVPDFSLRPIGQPAMTVRRVGTVRLNKEATKLLQKENATRVVLWWDSDKRKIAISVASEKDAKESLKLHFNKGSAQFAAKGAFREIGWSLPNGRSSAVLVLKKSDDKLESLLPAEYLSTATDSTNRGRRRRSSSRD